MFHFTHKYGPVDSDREFQYCLICNQARKIPPVEKKQESCQHKYEQLEEHSITTGVSRARQVKILQKCFICGQLFTYNKTEGHYE